MLATVGLMVVFSATDILHPLRAFPVPTVCAGKAHHGPRKQCTAQGTGAGDTTRWSKARRPPSHRQWHQQPQQQPLHVQPHRLVARPQDRTQGGALRTEWGTRLALQLRVSGHPRRHGDNHGHGQDYERREPDCSGKLVGTCMPLCGGLPCGRHLQWNSPLHSGGVALIFSRGRREAGMFRELVQTLLPHMKKELSPFLCP
ncbi:hypothetical protein V5799_009063 [Amblyomma americanum]|uniref:Secreted protein n=1 Tax=Amblyomma americanum TaxID=6943 RepID=A0AAQ4FD36_AMBAM